MNRLLYKLVAVDEGRDNGDGTFTTVELHNNSNQVTVKKIVVDGREYLLIDKIIK